MAAGDGSPSPKATWSPIRRTSLAAVAAVAALAALPGPALAGDGGGQRAMSPDEIYALTCGHLGVPCAIARPHAHHARAHHARARHARHRRAAAARR